MVKMEVNLNENFINWNTLEVSEILSNSVFETSLVPLDQEVSSSDVIVAPVPTCNSWSGDYDFKVKFHEQESPTKSASWVYSLFKQKLFGKMNEVCPIQFCTSKEPPHGSQIRATAVYEKQKGIHDVIRRCPFHSKLDDETNRQHFFPEHFIRCEHISASYSEDKDGNYYVIVPYEKPSVGSSSTEFLFKFMCFSSCAGGINRRQVKLVFMLEYLGECLGVQSVGLKICACPGRDKITEEAGSGSGKKILKNPKLKRLHSSGSDDSESSGSKHRRSGDNGPYVMEFKSRRMYEKVREYAEFLEEKEARRHTSKQRMIKK